jgi:DNA replication and repair protein RecF
MRILHLSLTNFRNYTRLEVDLPEGIVLIQGDNAQGKTNLLEAIHFLSHIHSPRVKTDRELVNWLVLQDNLPFARLVARVQRQDEIEQIELSLMQSNSKNLGDDASGLRKHIRVNGGSKRAADASGFLSCVLFLPEDIDLVSGAPGPRRRYLDDVIGQVDARYSHELQRYNRVLTRRNFLLKSFRGRAPDPAQLTFWDQRLIEHGAHLTIGRHAAIGKLNALIQSIHSVLTGDTEWLRLEYCSNTIVGVEAGAAVQMGLPTSLPASEPAISVQDVAASFAAQLREAQAKELEQGMSTIGPHRDDFRFLVNGVDMNTYGSRGQQRTVALSLKLAEVEWLGVEKNDRPVLLLDDIMSELDAAHRGCVLQAIEQAQQVIVTTTDATQFGQEFLAKASLWQVQAGRIHRLTST